MVELLQIRHHRVQALEVLPPAVDQGLPAEEDVGVGVAGDLVAPGQQTAHQLRTVDHAPLAVLAEVRVVVIGHAPPAGGAVLARPVRVVGGGVPHHVKGAPGPVPLQRLRQHLGQGFAPESVRGRRQAAGAVVKGHGADPLPDGHLLDAPHWGEVYRGPLPDLILEAMLGLFGQTDAFGKKRHGAPPHND